MPKRSQVEKKSKFSRIALTTIVIPLVLCVILSFVSTCFLIVKLIMNDMSAMENAKMNARLDYLTKLTERQQLLIPYKLSINCTLAHSYSANLTQLSNGKKYLFSFTNEAAWAVANENCKGMGLHLATPRDHDDLIKIWREAKKRSTRYGDGMWLSARNYGSGGKYEVRWHDGSELQENSTLWRNEADKKSCVYFYTYKTEKLNSATCTSETPFICELPSECY
ncbi:uncharacterized protein LOC132197805 [Neocloeon triangulifer]|uniref:uncharacterized protein LOC132197805 n=1 Tax=Neocloeon triangulifer TaxID=2078957 RepID=UPI00286F0A5D|nr:uncharacterized protein LOC132197805 [Neocloeon triangulifer]